MSLCESVRLSDYRQTASLIGKLSSIGVSVGLTVLALLDWGAEVCQVRKLRGPKLFFAAAAVLWIGAAGLPANAIDSADAFCRYKVTNAARMYLNHLAQRINTCHQRRMRGDLPAAINCNDPSSWAANGYASGAAKMQTSIAKIQDLASSCRPVGETPASVGYSACPAPCGGLPVSNFAEVGLCMKCVVDSCLLPAAQQIYGTVPLPVSYYALQCQQVMGRKMEEYTTKRLFLEGICRVNQERGKPSVQGLDCIAALETPTTAISVAHDRAMNDFNQRIFNRCDLVANVVAELDSCASDASTALSCVFAATSSCADTVYQASMP